MIKITVSEEIKQMLAKFGANKLFGDDVDERRKLDRTEAIALFDRVWHSTLEREVRSADKCNADDAKPRLTPSQQSTLTQLKNTVAFECRH